jgi:hypothetical protein
MPAAQETPYFVWALEVQHLATFGLLLVAATAPSHLKWLDRPLMMAGRIAPLSRLPTGGAHSRKSPGFMTGGKLLTQTSAVLLPVRRRCIHGFALEAFAEHPTWRVHLLAMSTQWCLFLL